MWLSHVAVSPAQPWAQHQPGWSKQNSALCCSRAASQRFHGEPQCCGDGGRQGWTFSFWQLDGSCWKLLSWMNAWRTKDVWQPIYLISLLCTTVSLSQMKQVCHWSGTWQLLNSLPKPLSTSEVGRGPQVGHRQSQWSRRNRANQNTPIWALQSSTGADLQAVQICGFQREHWELSCCRGFGVGCLSPSQRCGWVLAGQSWHPVGNSWTTASDGCSDSQTTLEG